MIADAFPTRLYWCGLRGTASWHGRVVRLTAPPHLPGLEIDAIDLVPGTLAMVMPRHGGWRDLEPAEQAVALQLLKQLAGVDVQTSAPAPTQPLNNPERTDR